MQEFEYTKDSENDFDLMQEIRKYLDHWYWFLFTVIVFLLVAFFYLRYTVPQYKITATVLVKDDAKGGLASELSAFSDLGLGKGKSNVDNEIEILKSRSLVEATVQDLQFQVQLFAKGKVRTSEIYGDQGVKVRFVSTDQRFLTTATSITLKMLANDQFSLIALPQDDASKESILMLPQKQYRFGEAIATKVGTMVVDKGARAYDKGEELVMTIQPLEKVVDAYVGAITVAPLSKTTSVVSLSVNHAVPQKAEYFLNNLVRIYNNNAVTDKNFISEKTAQFINNRLVLITEELDGVEKVAQTFKQENQLTDLVTQAGLYVAGSSEYDKKGVENEIQLHVISSMLDVLKNNGSPDLLPGTLLSSTGAESTLIAEYNALLMNRNRLLKSASKENPSVLRLEEQIQSLKENVRTSLKRLQANLQIQKNDLANQQGMLHSKIAKIPNQERQFRSIARQQKVKEELYLYLLQKREETAIALSTTEPNARVIDKARANPIPVSPKNNIVYLAALLLGLLVPFGVLYLRDLLDNKINSRLDLDQLSSIPFIGDVPTSDSPSEIMSSSSRSSSAEALRIIRTNLEFMFSKVPDGNAKTLFLTSTFPTEGKTFVSVNLASTFALTGKKVLLMGMDIRNPRLSDYLNVPERGVTNYLSAQETELKDLIVKYPGFEDLWVLPAGVIPPNPAELLMSKKVDVFFQELKKQYDYIIVDTAPVSLVTDTLLIAKYADAFVYVIRANFLEKRMMAIPNELYRDKKLPNMCLLLNDTDSSKGYGYGYGYGTKVVKKPWYQKIIKG